MVQRIVYSITAVSLLICTALTITSIIHPHWLIWTSHTASFTTTLSTSTTLASGTPLTTPTTPPLITYSLGLSRKCSSLTGQCTPFPTPQDCALSSAQFCPLWRSVGWLLSFAVIVEAAGLSALAIVLLGGVEQRGYGWKVVVPLLGLASLVQVLGVGIVAYLFEHEERFFPGWRLDTSWILSTISWAVLAVSGAGIVIANYVLPTEGGYELILDHA